MYISLDMQNMKIVHKHSSLNVVCDLVYIELAGVPVDVGSYDVVIKHKTDMEIKMLFRSCFPEESDHLPISEMKSRILQFVEAFPETDLDELKVKHQVDSICDKKAHRYIKGSFRTSQPTELSADVTGGSIRAGTTLPVDSTTRPVAPRTTASAPRSRGVRQKIWAVADRMWEEAGKPTEKSIVLALRKDIMDVLEQDGVKRTSSSSALGDWQKTRIT